MYVKVIACLLLGVRCFDGAVYIFAQQ